MAIYLKKFENHTQYDTYINSSGAILPNVSICATEGDVHYNPIETRVVAKYNVTDTSSPTMIASGITNFTSIEIDGVEQQSVVSAYTFSTTGEHTVKYTLTDPATIGEHAFDNCRSLTSIVMPNSVTTIGSSAFTYCTGITSCTIGSGVTSIGDFTFYYCSGLTSIDIPDSVTSIGDYAFAYCHSLTSCTIGSGVTRIGNYTFEGCNGLTSINIPDSVTSIGNYALRYCSGLTSIVIPSGVTNIGNMAFQDCRGLTSITSNRTTAPTISSNTFRNIKANGTLYVPQGSSGYDVWMGTGNYYLGKYNWTKVEQ